MRARVLTTVVGGPLMLGALIAGGLWWAAFVAIVVVLALLEWRTLIHHYLDALIPLEALLAGGLYAVAAAYGTTEGGCAPPMALGWAPALLLLTVYSLGRETFGPRRRPVAATGSLLLGVVYVAGLLSHLVLLRQWSPDGLALALLAVVGTWVTDSGAFFIGRAVGGRKLIPAISPGKTVSGAIGGWVSGFVVLLLAGVFWVLLPLGKALLLAACIPVAAMVGDLLESALKRETDVKDTGRLLPGHGGVLDRFDSLLLVAPVVYYIVTSL